MTIIATRNNRTGRAVHDLAFTTPDGIECDCGHLSPDPAAWHLHTVETFNHPSPEAIKARGRSVLSVARIAPSVGQSTVVECAKVACHNQGNGRECFRLHIARVPMAEKVLYELPRDVAERIAREGALVSTTHLYSFC